MKWWNGIRFFITRSCRLIALAECMWMCCAVRAYVFRSVSTRITKFKIHPPSFSTTIHIALRLSWDRNLSLLCNDKMRHSSRSTNSFNGVSFASCFWHECAFCAEIHHVIHTSECVSNLVENYSNASKWHQPAKGSVRTKPYAGIKFS